MPSQSQQAESAAETSAAGTAATADPMQSATQAAAVASQAQPSQTAAATAPGKDPNQQSVSAVAQPAMLSAEQWYQQQQQYQQYYQQYPGYDPHQQHYQNYYPYHQAAAPQYQQQHVQTQAPHSTGQHQPQVYVQSQPQPQLQPQSQPQVQAAVATQPQVQVAVATQPHNQAQVNLAQQVHAAVPSHSQIQSQTYPLAHGHPQPQPPYSQNQLHPQPHSQHVQMTQYQQPHPQPQIQQQTHPQPQIQQQTHPQPQIQQQTQLQVQPQYHPPSQSHPLSQTQPHVQFQQNQPLHANFQSQTQHPSTHAVTGHQSYPQPNTDPQVQIGTSQQYPLHVQSQVLPSLQSQNPVQLQSQGPQQPPLMRAPLSYATVPGQQQPALLPSPGQVQNIPPAQQQSIHPHLQQPGQAVHQRPVMQPIQQTFPQQHFQQQLPMPSQLRPQGKSHIFPPQTHAYPQLVQNVALSHGMQHAKSPNPVGRPSMPTGSLLRPMYPGANQQSTNQNNMLKTNNQMLLPSEQQTGVNSKLTMSEREGDHTFEKGSTQKEAAHKSVKVGANDLKSVPDIAANVDGIKTEKSETNMKSMDTNQARTTSKEIPKSMQMLGPESETYSSENGEPKVKPIMKDGLESTLRHSSKGKPGEVVVEDTKDVLKVGPEKMKHSTVEDKQTLDVPPQKMTSLQAIEKYGGQGGNLLKDASSGPEENSQGVSMASAQILGSPAQNFTSRGTAPGSEVESLQPLPSHFGPSTVQQRPGEPPFIQVPPHQTQGLGPPQTYFRPQKPPGNIPDPGFALSFARGPSLYGPAQQSSELQSIAPLGPYNHGHSPKLSHTGAFRTSQGESVGASLSGALPPPPFDLHGGMMARATPHGPERPKYMDGRGSLEQRIHAQPSSIHPNMMRMNGSMGFDASSAIGSRDERLPMQDERFNPFPPGPDHRVSDRAVFENDMKQFPRPFLDAETMPKFGNLSARPFNKGPPVDPGAGSGPSRFLSPYNGGGANDARERPGGHHEDTFGRIEPTRGHLDFFGPGPAYGRHHMDSLALRSPGREHHGVSHGFRGQGFDDIHGREVHRFGEPFGSSFHESRFSMLPSHLRRGDFEGPGNVGMGDYSRHDLIGRDSFSSHLRRGEHMGNLYGRLRFGEPDGFGVHPRHGQIREMGGPGSFDSFGGVGRPRHPHFGEPGFRSSFSLHGFPNDDDIYTVKCFFPATIL